MVVEVEERADVVDVRFPVGHADRVVAKGEEEPVDGVGVAAG